MTAHLHTELVDGCYRCDLNKDEDPWHRSIRLVHGRDTCDEAGRPLSTYVCDYHQGYRDALDADA